MMFPLRIVTIMSSFFFFTGVQGECPSGWQHFNESCYQFVPHERTWTSALVHCFRQGSRLVKVETKEENEFIRNYLINNGGQFYGYDLWMGGRKVSQGNWDWADGSLLLPDHFEDWHDGHPPSSADRNMCMEFEADYTYHWNDDFCDDISYSICERPFEPLTPPTPTNITTTTTKTTTTTTNPMDGIIG